MALDPDTGEYLWHYQTSPGEIWDFTSTMDIVLVDLDIEGEQVKALMHAPKNGFFYVINRENSELISAENYTEVTWASVVDLETGRPIENPGVRYELEPVDIAPSPFGGHNWHAMSYNPGTGMVYIPTIHWQFRFADAGIDLEDFQAEGWRTELGVAFEYGASTRDDGVMGALQAWDPVRQQQVWEIPTDGPWDAGTLTTASNLLFQGKANGHLRAFNALTGEQLWDENLGLGISAPPITYSVNGKQYLAILVGWGGVMSALGGQEIADYGWAYGEQTRRLFAFSLDGTRAVPLSTPPRVPTPLATSDFIVDGATAESGALDYESICSACHGGVAIAAGMAPDLRASGVILSADAFEQVVRGGTLKSRGMPPFADFSDADLNSIRHYIRHYIRQQAELALSAEQ